MKLVQLNKKVDASLVKLINSKINEYNALNTSTNKRKIINLKSTISTLRQIINEQKKNYKSVKKEVISRKYNAINDIGAHPDTIKEYERLIRLYENTSKRSEKKDLLPEMKRIENIIKDEQTNIYHIEAIFYERSSLKEIREQQQSGFKVRYFTRREKSFGKWEKVYYIQISNVWKLQIKNARILKYADDKYTFAYPEIRDVFDEIQEVWRFTNNEDKYKENFNQLKKILESVMQTKLSSYIDCIYISPNYQVTKNIIVPTKPNKNKLANIKLRDELQSKYIYNKYIQYSVNQNAKTFSEVFNSRNFEKPQSSSLSNACFINILVETFKKPIESAMNNKKGCRIYKNDITHDYLLKMFGINQNSTDFGITIIESLKFFQKYSLGLVCMDAMGKIFYEYRPTTANKNIFPSVLYILVINNHVFKLNHKIASLSKIYTENKLTEDEEYLLSVTNRTYIKKDSACGEVFKTFMCSNVSECVKHLNSLFIPKKLQDLAELTDKKIIFVMRVYDMKSVLFDLISNGYIPHISVFNNIIQKIIMRYDVYNIEFVQCDIKNDIYNLFINDLEIYNKYNEYFSEFSNKIMSKSHLSTFNKDTLNAMEYFYMFPCVYSENVQGAGCYGTTFQGIDVNKAYSHFFSQMHYVPVYNQFDTFQPYDEHEIEDYTQYIIKCNSNKTEDIILFPRLHDRTYGFVLKNISSDIEYTITHYWRPSKLVPINSKKMIDEIYSITDIPRKLLKHIPNVTLGMCEKKSNKKSITRIFYSYDEALHYQSIYGGKIYIFDNHFIDNQYKNDEESFKYKIIYCLVISKEEKLIDGFQPIKDYVYCQLRLFLHKYYIKLVNAGIDVYGISTDSFRVNVNDISDIPSFIKFSDVIGEFKFEECKPLRGHELNKIINKEFKFVNYHQKTLELKNEYNKYEIVDTLLKNNRTIVKGLYPGVGKTTSIMNISKSDNMNDSDILFISPFNRLCQELQSEGKTAITLNMLLNIGINGEILMKGKSYIDIHGKPKVICFDELLLYDPINLEKIYDFMNTHNDIYFYATGDTKQNKPFAHGLNNIPDIEKYLNRCISIMFPNQIVLKEIKRLNNENDKMRIQNLYDDLFNHHMNPIEAIKKANINTIDNINQLKTTKNICYFNFRRSILNDRVYKNFIQKPKENDKNYLEFGDLKITKGFELICKDYFKNNKSKFFRNYLYKIMNIDYDNDTWTLLEPVSKQTYELPYTSDIVTKFTLPYAQTCHSVQGLSISEPITIFDCNTPYVDINFIWTAITRCRDLNNVTVFIHSEKEVLKLNDAKIKQHHSLKIDSYKNQDRKAKRKVIEKEYVNHDWILKKLEESNECPYCHCSLYTILHDNNQIDSNISINRVNSELPHTMKNCQLTCSYCNMSKGNRDIL